MTPDSHTGRCKLEAFRGESSLTNWLKTVCLYYCYRKYELKDRSPIKLQLDQLSETDDGAKQKKSISYEYEELDISSVNHQDVMTILNMMPNRRYASLIRLRYLEQMSNEETAAMLGMSLENYYNKHKLAKAQYEQVLRKEVRHG
jgi:DNA-directed RNA polymerase specialized sigma24 family protein